MAVKNSIPSQLHNSVNQAFSFTTAMSTNLQDLITISSGEEKETRLKSILINNLEATTRILYFYVHDGTNSLFIGDSGTVAAAVSPVNGKKEVVAGLYTPLLERVRIDEKGNPELCLFPGEKLQAKLNTAVGTNNYILLSITGYNFER